MCNTDRGVLMLYEWFDAMSLLNPKDYKEMTNAIFRYQLYGEEPPEFKGKSAIVAAMIFPYIARRIYSARAAKAGAQSRSKEEEARERIRKILEQHAKES